METKSSGSQNRGIETFIKTEEIHQCKINLKIRIGNFIWRTSCLANYGDSIQLQYEMTLEPQLVTQALTRAFFISFEAVRPTKKLGILNKNVT